MVDAKTIVIIAAVAAFIAALGANYIPTNDYICPDDLTILHCEGGLSGGLHTRCYLNESGKSPWKVCSSGWEDISKYIDETGGAEQKTVEGMHTMTIFANGKVWTCATDGHFERAVRCVSGLQETHLGALL
uniref:Uncharacterized protein n=1 Tax=viral metagenome TaxID=1070528 RepID=A0A6H2A218_9ZZZZ